MSPPVRALRPALLVVVVTSLLLISGACSKSSSPTVKPADAADTVAGVYSLTDEQRTCLEQAFADDGAATKPLATGKAPSAGDLTALGQVEASCIDAATLGDAITGSAAGADDTFTDTQRACLRQGIDALSDTDRQTLLAGLTVARSLDDPSMAELGQVTSGLLQGCSVIDQGSTTETTATGP